MPVKALSNCTCQSTSHGLFATRARHVADHWRRHVTCSFALHRCHDTFAGGSRLHLSDNVRQRFAIW